MTDLQTLFVSLSARFAGLSYRQLDQGIEETLAELGGLTGVDRVYLFIIKGQFLTNTHEWCAEGISSERGDLPVEVFDAPLKQLSRGEVFIIPRVAELPIERQAERDILEAQGIRSLLAVPLSGTQGLIGLVGFDSVRHERSWRPDEVALLQATASLIAGAWQRRAAAEARDAAYNHLSKLAKTVPGVLYQYQHCPDGRSHFPYLSDSIERILGLPAATVIDAEILTLPDKRPVAELSRWEGEFRARHQDGGMRWLHNQATPEAQADGSVLWHGYIADITERKTMQEVFLRSEANLRALFDNTEDALVLFDSDYRLLVFNREAEARMRRVLGITPQAGLDIREEFAKRDPPALQDLARVMAGEAVREERLVTRLDGSHYWAEMSVSPVRDSLGRVLGAAFRSSDITVRYQAEQALRREVELRQALLALNNELLGEELGEGFYHLLLKRALAVVPGAQAGSLLMRDEDGLYRFKAAIGHDLAKLQTLELTERELARRGRGEPELVHYKVENLHLAPEKQRVFEEGGRVSSIKVTLSTPITIAGRSSGLFNLDNFEHDKAFGSEAMVAAQALAAQAAIALQRLRLEAQLKAERDRYEHLAEHDALTGLPNRMLFHDRLDQALVRARRRDAVVSLVLFDLDSFKEVNDTLGHDAGDELLQHVAAQLLSAVRAEDTLARLGGDEFAVILGELARGEDAEPVVKKLLAALERPMALRGQAVRVSASFGISLYPTDATSPSDLLKYADMALYRAKGEGKRGYAFFRPELNAQIQERAQLESAMRQGLARGELFLHYQPRVDLVTGRIVGLEALLRWRHPTLGLVPPSRFIPLAEEGGLILDLGQEALRQACRQVKGWLDEGLAAVPVAVNLSAREFHQADLVQKIERILHETGLPPNYLELEITESAAMSEAAQAVRTLDALRALGISITIDDFGTAYSSLNYLKRLPVNALKIDRSFVLELCEAAPPQDAAIIMAIIGLGRAYGLTVVAEGVETEFQRESLMQLGCRYAQGYLFSRPVPAAEIQAWLSGPGPHKLPTA